MTFNKNSRSLQLLLMAFVGVAVLGNHFPVLGYHAFRLAVAFVVVVIFLAHTKTYNLSDSGIPFIQFMLTAFWGVWALLSTLVHGAPEHAVRELAELFLGIVMLWVPYWLAYRVNKADELLIDFWLFAFLLSSGFALVEFVSGTKLESDFTRAQPDRVFDSFFLVSTFANPNNFAVFLLLCLPFLTVFFLRARTRSVKVFAILLLLLLFVQLVLTGSRLGIGAGLLFFTLWLSMHWRKRPLSVLFLVSLTWVAFSGVMSEFAVFDSLLLTNKVTDIDQLNYGSVPERFRIMAVALEIAAENALFGVGPGGFEEYVSINSDRFGVSNPNTHSMFLEVAAQYGLLVFILFAALFIAITNQAWRLFSHRGIDSQTAETAYVVCAAMVVFAISLNINSTYISLYFVWLFLGSIGAFACCVSNQAAGWPAVSQHQRGEGLQHHYP